MDFRFATIGHLKRGEAKQTFDYALIDAKDRPFVTFRYHFVSIGERHSWEALKNPLAHHLIDKLDLEASKDLQYVRKSLSDICTVEPPGHRRDFCGDTVHCIVNKNMCSRLARDTNVTT